MDSTISNVVLVIIVTMEVSQNYHRLFIQVGLTKYLHADQNFVNINILDEIDTSSGYLLKLSFAIFGPVFIIGGLAILVIIFMRRNHQKRLLATRSKQDPDTYYGTDDFRATSAGDSTLRVYASVI